MLKKIYSLIIDWNCFLYTDGSHLEWLLNISMIRGLSNSGDLIVCVLL